MRRHIHRGVMGAAALVAVLSSAAAPAALAFDGLVVNDTSVTAEQQGTSVTAEVTLVNPGREQQPLSDVTISPACVARPSVKVLEPLQATTVTLVFDGDCFGDPPHSVVVELGDVRRPVPPITVAPPEAARSDWAPAQLGAITGLALFVAVLIWGWRRHAAAISRLDGEELAREVEYQQVQQVVDRRIAELGGDKLQWKPLPPPHYDWWRGSVGNLEAGWSLQGSFVSNLTLSTTALVALVTSVDAATAVLGAEPKAAFRVMATVGLVSAVLIACANLVLKVAGPSLSAVTPFGLTVSTGIAIGAATLQSVTVGAAAAGLVDPSSAVTRIGVWLLTAAVTVALVTYGFKALSGWLVAGPPSGVPTIPLEALVAWKADSDWDGTLVEQRIRTAFQQWLEPDSFPSPHVRHVQSVQELGAEPGPTPGLRAALPPGPPPLRQRALL